MNSWAKDHDNEAKAKRWSEIAGIDLGTVSGKVISSILELYQVLQSVDRRVVTGRRVRSDEEMDDVPKKLRESLFLLPSIATRSNYTQITLQLIISHTRSCLVSAPL